MVDLWDQVDWLDWEGLLHPHSRDQWHQLLGAFIRHAPHLPQEAIELLAQIAERKPKVRLGRRGRDQLELRALISGALAEGTQGQAIRKLASTLRIDEPAARQVMLRWRRSKGRKRDLALYERAVSEAASAKERREAQRVASLRAVTE